MPAHSREHQRPDAVGFTAKVDPQISHVALPRLPHEVQYFCRLEVGWKLSPQVAHCLDSELTDAFTPAA